MVMNPSSNVCKIDAYPNADFPGIYGHEDHTDLLVKRVATDSSSTFAECSMLWQLKLQTETALSLFMMEAKIIALSGCCRELLPIIIMVCSLAKSTNLLIGNTTMNVSTLMKTIWEHWCWPKLCLHSYSFEASIMQSRLFDFVKRFSSMVFNYSRSTLSNNGRHLYKRSSHPSCFWISQQENHGMIIPFILSLRFKPWILDSSLERECCTR